jgi:hypothetical protein
MVMKTLGTSPSFCSTSLLVYELFFKEHVFGLTIPSLPFSVGLIWSTFVGTRRLPSTYT